MSSTTRELIKGIAGGAGFLMAALVVDLPLPLAGLIGAGVFVSLGFLLPKRLRTGHRIAAPGLTEEERDRFLLACRNSTAELARLAAPLPKQEFAGTVNELVKIATNLSNYLEKKPDGILLAYSLPQNLEHLAGMLRQYVTISHYTEAGPTAAQALRQVEDIFASAQASLAGIYQQLLHHDVAALEASTRTLAILMGVEAQVAEEAAKHRPAPQPESPAVGQPRAASLRRSQQEKES